MTNINGLMRQRVMINENINTLKCLCSLNCVVRDSARIGKTINQLEVKLKIYLKAEQELLTQYLLQYNNNEEVKIIEQCLSNINNVSVEYSRFRRRFGSREKICSNLNEFKNESEIIIKLLGESLNIRKIIGFFYGKETIPA
jgi:hypothetical protein